MAAETPLEQARSELSAQADYQESIGNDYMGECVKVAHVRAILAAPTPEPQIIRARVLDEIAIWFEGFEFPEAPLLAEQVRLMAKDAVEDAAPTPEPARLSAEGWQPIETAPKDGTNIILGWPTMAMSGYWADWRGRKSWVTARGEYGGSAAPTHWMPLPAPPQGTDAE